MPPMVVYVCIIVCRFALHCTLLGCLLCVVTVVDCVFTLYVDGVCIWFVGLCLVFCGVDVRGA